MIENPAPNLSDYLWWRITSGKHYLNLMKNATDATLQATRARITAELPIVQAVYAAVYDQVELSPDHTIWATYLNLCAWTYYALADYHSDADAHRARQQLLHERDRQLNPVQSSNLLELI